MALDFAPVDDDFDKTPGGKWVYENAAKYGWSLSFPKGYEDVTGYRWECWHFRYIGVEACNFQKKWFGDVQQFMIEFINCWEMSS
jgi:D-alanyl-D-alanine carboxypeptidase